MSQTTQFVSIPLAVGVTTANISSTAWGVGGAKIEDGSIKFAAGPDCIGARYPSRKVIVQGSRKRVPPGFQGAGLVASGGRKLKVFVEMPEG